MSAYPLLVEPTHYTGQPGYFTDTEDSPTVDDETVKKLKGDPDLLPSSFNTARSVQYNIELWWYCYLKYDWFKKCVV